MTLTAHPYADKFPMLPELELAELAESIRANGLRSPIVVTQDGLILDGRNRAAACDLVGITPETVVYKGDDLAEYVIDCNVTRRNMTTGARAMSTALVLEAAGRRDGGRWKYGHLNSNDLGNSMAEYVRQCGVILDYQPDLARAVVAGDLALDAAYQQAKQVKDSAERDKIMAREKAKREREEAAAEAERNAKIVADLTVAGSRYVAMIESGAMTPAAAWAAHREDTRKEREQADADRRNAEQTIRTACEALANISLWSYPEARARTIAAYRGGHGRATRPGDLEWHTPTNIRRIAAWLNEYATELEETK